MRRPVRSQLEAPCPTFTSSIQYDLNEPLGKHRNLTWVLPSGSSCWMQGDLTKSVRQQNQARQALQVVCNEATDNIPATMIFWFRCTVYGNTLLNCRALQGIGGNGTVCLQTNKARENNQSSARNPEIEGCFWGASKAWKTDKVYHEQRL